jgi:DedD protein
LQVGAYANPESAKTMAARARKAGVRAYTETIQTAEGARTRVRIGPFADREAAERSRGKLKLVGIDSTVVSLQR